MLCESFSVRTTFPLPWCSVLFCSFRACHRGKLYKIYTKLLNSITLFLIFQEHHDKTTTEIQAGSRQGQKRSGYGWGAPKPSGAPPSKAEGRKGSFPSHLKPKGTLTHPCGAEGITGDGCTSAGMEAKTSGSLSRGCPALGFSCPPPVGSRSERPRQLLPPSVPRRKPVLLLRLLSAPWERGGTGVGIRTGILFASTSSF